MYPIFLDLTGRLAVVIGAGPVALRKVRGLLEADAVVKVVSPRFHPEFEGLSVERIQREYQSGDLEGALLAFTATDQRQINDQVARDARARGILINVADARSECAFFVPARLRHEDLQIAVATAGSGPRRAAEVRDRIAHWLNKSVI